MLKLNDNELKIRNTKLSQTQTPSFTLTKHISRRHGAAFEFLKRRLYVTEFSSLSRSVFI